MSDQSSTRGYKRCYLTRCDRRRVNAEHQANPNEFRPTLIDPPFTGIQYAIQPTESLKRALLILHRARTPNHHSFVGRERIQAHHLEPRALPSCQGWYYTARPISGLLILKYQNDNPFSPVSINGPWGEILFRELIHKPTNRSLDAYKIFLGDLGLRYPSQTIAIPTPSRVTLAYLGCPVS